MKGPEAEKIINEQVQKCLDILVVKAGEYAPGDEDRLHNFKVSAGLHGSTMQAALAGMMAKHTTSVYDMCHADEIFSQEKWDEKITDHINYLLLLQCIVHEQRKELTNECKTNIK